MANVDIFSVPEILHDILRCFEKDATLLTMALVSRNWSDIALPIMWEELDDSENDKLVSLLATLGEVNMLANGHYSLHNSSTDGSIRFLYYSRMLKIIKLQSDYMTEALACASVILDKVQKSSIFPSLQSLELKWFIWSEEQVAANRIFMTSTVLRKLRADLRIMTNCSQSAPALLCEAISDNCLNLESLEIVYDSATGHVDTHITLTRLFFVLSKLTHVRISGDFKDQPSRHVRMTSGTQPERAVKLRKGMDDFQSIAAVMCNAIRNNCRRLERLEISYGGELGFIDIRSGLTHLFSTRNKLTHVQITGTLFDWSAIGALGSLPHLTSLNFEFNDLDISDTPLTGVDLKTVALLNEDSGLALHKGDLFSKLTSLSSMGNPGAIQTILRAVDEAHLEHINFTILLVPNSVFQPIDLPESLAGRLKSLILRYHRPNSIGPGDERSTIENLQSLQFLQNIVNLEVTDVRCTCMDNSDLYAFVQNFPQLIHLSIRYSWFEVDDVPKLTLNIIEDLATVCPLLRHLELPFSGRFEPWKQKFPTGFNFCESKLESLVLSRSFMHSEKDVIREEEEWCSSVALYVLAVLPVYYAVGSDLDYVATSQTTLWGGNLMRLKDDHADRLRRIAQLIDFGQKAARCRFRRSLARN